MSAEASRLGVLIRQLQGILGGSPPPAARVFHSTTQSITHNTATTLTFDSERYDHGDLHSTGSRLTAPVDGVYDIGTSIRYAANVTGIRQARLLLNGATIIALDGRGAVPGGNTTDIIVHTQYELAAGDYVEVVAYQDSGVSLNVAATSNYTPEFWMARRPS